MKFTAIFLICLLLPISARGEPPQCEPLASVEAKLATNWGETLIGYGTESRGSLVKLYENPETRTWTIIAIWTNKQACIISHGVGMSSKQQARLR